jgi:hypothetical protein
MKIKVGCDLIVVPDETFDPNDGRCAVLCGGQLDQWRIIESTPKRKVDAESP